MAPTIINLLDQCIPIQDTILQHLEIGDVISLAKSTKALWHLVKVVESTQFNINHALEPFFDAIAFRSLQAQHNALIASYFAYTFLSIQEGDHAEALNEFLIQAGYQEANLYAYATYIKKQSYLLVHVEEFENTFHKLAEGHVTFRPCSLADYVPDTVTHNSKLRLCGSRRIGDERSWIISLKTNNVATSPCPDDVIDLTEQKRFDDVAILGMYALKPEHQPESIGNIFRRRERGGWSEADMEAFSDWEPPKDVGWVYHDEEMMEMIRARHEKERKEEKTDGDA
ncbi:hypothetical protein BKA63DRAFT_495926 [Paraphoma chrysanthemicola]|nr:hypothetical protein BKA63DRAFT_495926 [Paraphoma chrysanthemicola]